MGDFYSSIVEYYEEIFVPMKAQIDFLEESSSGNKVLDIACGTGKVASLLNERGKEVTGIDLEDAMVEIAKDRNGVDARVMNMLDVESLNSKYNLVYCIGNSLPHLNDLNEIEKFIDATTNIIDNGNLVLQWINFYPFLKSDNIYLGSLPNIETKNLKFIRKYYRNNNKIRFNTELILNGKTLINDQCLYPLMVDDMVSILNNKGFTNIEVFGGFNKSPFDIETSVPVVLRASYENN